MRKILAVLLVSMLMPNFYLFATQTNDDKYASIEPERTKVDFGTVKPETMLIDTVYFRNNGNDTLRVNRIYPSCSCVSGWTNAKGGIQPGEKGYVVIKYTAGKTPGFFRHTVKIVSNAKDRVTRIAVVGNVE